MSAKSIDFKPVPGPDEGHYTLSIYPPGTFINNKGFLVFVGGCGVAEANNLEDAKILLLAYAKKTCQRRILEAERVAAHYQRMEAELDANGLQPEGTKI